MINVYRLTKEYGARRAIDNLTFTAEKGEIMELSDQMGQGKPPR